MQEKLTIAIDAMGGDNAPEAPVEGAVLASKNTNTQILLVGNQDEVQTELNKHNNPNLPIKIIPSEGKIEDGESPALALRQKPKSSILVSTSLVKKGLADAVISMGSTGGTMAAAVVVLGTIEGNDLITGKADVVVCDGFVGNIILKLVEGLGKGLAYQLQDYLSGKIDPSNIESLLKDLYQKNNVTDSRGGGPVYGVNGISIVGHGSATSGTVERAVDLARMCIETKLIEEMGKRVPKVMSTIN